MITRNNNTSDFEIIISDNFFEISSDDKSEIFYYKNVKKITLVSGQTNYLITALSWVVLLLFHIDGAGRYKDNDYIEIITKDNKSVKKNLIGVEKNELQNSIKKIQQHIIKNKFH